jgi:citrate lyase beta subunit
MTRGLTPLPDEVAEAQRMLDFWNQLDADGEAEGVLDGKPVDRYEAARAAELLEWAQACAAMDAHKERMVAATRARLASAES